LLIAVGYEGQARISCEAPLNTLDDDDLVPGSKALSDLKRFAALPLLDYAIRAQQ
jgi:hypothetical protein